MAMFVYVDDNGSAPAEYEVTGTSSDCDSYTQPHIVRHKYEH